MSRKDILRVPQPKASSEPSSLRPTRAKVLPMLNAEAPPAASRLTHQVGTALAEGKARFERAEEIERRLAEGQAVVELDTDEIDPSFVQDRMDGDIAGLLSSIKEQGQQVPILVRPHPERTGHYQIAFGHRRLRALKKLGLKAKAIVRDLSDEQLVIAQGQENHERQDLTFIEKARFAARLKEKFSRDVIIASLSVDKGDLSKMLAIVDVLPAELVEAIGSAPSVGRPRWLELSDLVEKSPTPRIAVEFAMSDEVKLLRSDDRFKAIIAHLKPRRTIRGAPGVLTTTSGVRLAEMKNSKSKLEITIDKKLSPAFAAFILEKLPMLYEEHLAENQRKNGE
ncbi:plasmid partitioning protein RepB [Rhizobium sp. CFBP 8752]|uniref:plasmid partitioning protein RepB n=1 Tax=Rhizobium sp. CFBP 8752 TaxID=2775301 RepID=UPI001783059C|nr:plasmid partitioning protein RepB [Rhizobium sp. CFBP 8752]MBD8665896.1 plasmid partitioning protein RepB [Rhizobium sp. CFBP 8752]